MTKFATATKEALSNVEVDEEFGPITGAGQSNTVYLTFNEPKVPSERSRVWTTGKAGAVIGEYTGSFVDQTFGGNRHKIRVGEETVVLPRAAQLDKNLTADNIGTRFRIVYEGKSMAKNGKEAHGFAISASRLQQR
jgi:hypothetical protein